jgi:hypothetical protein
MTEKMETEQSAEMMTNFMAEIKPDPDEMFHDRYF